MISYIHIYKILFFVSISWCCTSLKLNAMLNKGKQIAENTTPETKQCVISSRNKTSYCNTDSKLFIENNDYYSNKKLITISPGGFKGFYLLGVLAFLKENYNLDEYIFSGASAGAWNCIFMCYKGNTKTLIYDLLDINIRRAKSISELQYFLKYKLLSSYKTDDFDLTKIFIGVTTFKNFFPNINIYSDFQDLEDAINCCMASSHIPLITGGVTNRYKEMFSFDGGFSTYPYLNKERTLHVSPSMWDDIKNSKNQHKCLSANSVKRNLKTLKKFGDFFSISKNNLLELFDNGHQDAKLHKSYFDSLFEPKTPELDSAIEI